MFHLFLVYPSIVAMFLPYQQEGGAHYILDESQIDFWKRFDLSIRTFDHTYTCHELLTN